MSRWVAWTLFVLLTLSLVPFVFIARARTGTSPEPRLHVFFDMDNQPRFKPQQANPLFADGRAMRPPVPGTVARELLRADDRYYRGVSGDEWVSQFPVRVDDDLMARGRERYEVHCTPCHGLSGYGDGIVSRRADRLQEGAWVPPSSFHTDLVRGRPVGHLYNTITNGIRNMPAYGSRMDELDRWAIVAYVRALQRSQMATVEDVPPQHRGELDQGS